MNYDVAAFYQFIPLPNAAASRESLRQYCSDLEIKGTILLAAEGINGTLAGTNSAIRKFVDMLRTGTSTLPAFDQLEVKFSKASKMPFQRLKIRLKSEIVALGTKVDPTSNVGKYVSPAEWNALLESPDVLLIDTRNNFEVEMGTFPGAINPQTERFSDFPVFVEQSLQHQKHKKIAMFCTGGIRCEKASSYLLSQGFGEVYHLKGGILNYLEHVRQSHSKWQGDCFVFDDRVKLTHESFYNEEHKQNIDEDTKI